MTVYIDPYVIGGGPTADLVLITHDHYDHCSREDVKKISGSQTTIVAPPSCIKKLGSLGGERIPIKPGERLEVKGAIIEAIPAYNVHPARKNFHPREKDYVGYILELSGVRVYHAGDTDLIPEMEELEVDVALLPVSGTYVMDAEEAAKAAEIIRPKVAIPMHYGSVAGSKRDAEKFKDMVKACEVVILRPEN
ncbi:MAG TPA: MBL fold metallo-hydrolase [Candidatus Korarchaeota archaeon]|nr:MBL fold metallo-hydrolase [Candidatus Korarchaeota archaeon]